MMIVISTIFVKHVQKHIYIKSKKPIIPLTYKSNIL